MAKVKVKELPETFKIYFDLSSNVHSRNTKHAKSGNYHIPRFNKVKCQRSITVIGSKIQNKLPQEIKNKLKKGCQVFITQLKSTYCIHSNNT